MSAICAKCVSLHGDAKRDSWYRWMCVRVPLETVLNPVTGSMTEPYQLCRKINDGSCEMYEEGPNCLQPKTKE